MENNSKYIHELVSSLKKTEALNEGTWGVKPLQSDGVLDIRDGLIKKNRDAFLKEIEKRCDDEPQIAWYAVGLCEFLMDDFIKMEIEFFLKDTLVLDYYEKAIEKCNNEEWFKEWKNPDEIRASVASCKEKLKKYSDIINNKK